MQVRVNVVERADQLTEEELNALPVGLIQLDPEGKVLTYNRTESRLAGFDPDDVIDRNFFYDIAPCARVQEFYGRFRAGVEARELHEVFPFEFDFRDGRQRDVVITLFYSGQTDTVWLQVTR